jgi:hypothetical protein
MKKKNFFYYLGLGLGLIPFTFLSNTMDREIVLDGSEVLVPVEHQPPEVLVEVDKFGQPLRKRQTPVNNTTVAVYYLLKRKGLSPRNITAATLRRYLQEVREKKERRRKSAMRVIEKRPFFERY